ncbi:hypothetical protein IFM89_000408 [Coptis chinensis]|uniref:Uncharacterized protein n=1 Tax=Coptis chinensis TaxID=261450 RepID=A0A835H886_9MAGN|nr:hypothetical protein IFM89_000408 [Coptis chinensis]
MPTRHLPPTTPLPAEDMAGETRPLTEAEPPLSSRHYHPLLGEGAPPIFFTFSSLWFFAFCLSFKLHYQFNKFDGKLLASGMGRIFWHSKSAHLQVLVTVSRILSAYLKVPPKLEVKSTKRDLNLFGTGDGEIDFEESETVGKNVMETATSITNASNAANPGQYQPPAVIPPSFRSPNVPTTVPALELPYAPSPRSGPSLPFPNFSETSIISNRVTNLVKPSVFHMQPPLSTYMIPSTSSSTPTTPINGLGITRDKVRDTLMRLVQGFTHDDPVLSFKMGKQEVLRKWSSSLNAYLELVFRDNKLMKMPDVSIFKSLLVFGVSYNEISSLNGVSKVSSTLKELYVSKNEVTKMEELDHLYNLHILELGSNRLRVMENLHNLTNLQELWLGRNRIRTVNLCGLKCIRKISLQRNRLTNMTGFQDCVALGAIMVFPKWKAYLH